MAKHRHISSYSDTVRALLLCVREIKGSDLCPETCYLDYVFCAFPQPLQVNTRIWPDIRPLGDWTPFISTLAYFDSAFQFQQESFKMLMMGFTSYSLDTRIRYFVAIFTRILHLFLFWDEWVHSTPPPATLRSIPNSSSHLRLGLQSYFFLSGFHTKTLYNFLSYSMRSICPAHFILLDLFCLNIFVDGYKLSVSSLCNFLHSPVTSFHLGQNILLTTLFSDTLNLCSSLNSRDQVSHQYKINSRIMVLYILTFTFLDGRREDKTLWTER
jgi:hypothetical protein